MVGGRERVLALTRESYHLRWRMPLTFAILVRLFWFKFERDRTKHPLRLTPLPRYMDGWKGRKDLSFALLGSEGDVVSSVRERFS